MKFLASLIAIGLMCMTATSCCRHPYAVDDKIEAGIAIGFYERPKHDCCIVPWDLEPRRAEPGVDVPVWFRVISREHPGQPASSREVTLSVVFPTGSLPDSGLGVTIRPSKISSDVEGFNAQPISFRSQVPGSFLIRAEYADGRSSAVSYSKPINVFANHVGKVIEGAEKINHTP